MNENELQVLRELVEIGAEELMSTDPRVTLAEPVDPGPVGSYPGNEMGRRMDKERDAPKERDSERDSLDPREAFTQWKAAQKKRPAPTPRRRRHEPLDGQLSLTD